MTTSSPGSVNQQPLYGCTSCYEECTYPADHLHVHDGECWCDLCWDARRDDFPDQPDWGDLEPYTPALQAECERIRKDAEATRKSVKLLNYLFARNIIAMQSAVIEWEKGKGAAAGMQWIWNTLFGPGQIPDEDETDAQAYFDREIEPLDAAMQGGKL